MSEKAPACPDCQGTGLPKGFEAMDDGLAQDCPTCGGTGKAKDDKPRPPFEEKPTMTVHLWHLSETQWYGCTVQTPTSQAVEAWGMTRADVVMRLMVAAKGLGR